MAHEILLPVKSTTTVVLRLGRENTHFDVASGMGILYPFFVLKRSGNYFLKHICWKLFKFLFASDYTHFSLNWVNCSVKQEIRIITRAGFLRYKSK